jgi:putative inorganic carbon (HCO3(-)) transporter
VSDLAQPAPRPVTTDRRRSSVTAMVGLFAAIALGLVVGGITAQSPVLGLAAVLAMLGAVAVAIRPDAAVLIVVGLIYSNAPVVLVQYHGVPVLLAAAVPFILAAPLAYDILVERREIILPPATPWLALFLVVQMLSTIGARDAGAAAAALGAFAVEGFGLYLLVVNTVRTPEILRGVVWVLLVVGAALGALSLFQQLTGTYGNAYFGFAQTDAAETGLTETGLARLAGPIGEKNRYAQIMLMLVPLAIMQATAERQRILRLAALGAGGLAAIATALTFSRGAALAAGLIVLAMIAMRYVRLSHVLAALVMVGAVLVAVPAYAERVASLADIGVLLADEPAGSATDNSLLSRATENLAALNVFADHPLLGVGPEQFPAYYRDYADEIGISVRAADREAHNLYLEIAAETGILGLIAFLGAVVATLVQLARARARALARRPDLAAMASGFMLALVAYLATGIFLHLSYARYFWLVLALAGAAGSIVLRTMAEDDAAGSRASAGPGRADA